MLDPSEKRAFDAMVARLGDEDPGFVRRIDRIGRPRPRLRMMLAVLLWTIAPVCIVVGGWTGLIMGVVAVGYGFHLRVRRDRSDPRVAGWPSNRRPEASF